MLIINTISRPVFFIRDGRTVETNNTGERITQEEFSTLISEKEVICVDEATGLRYTYTPDTPVVYMTTPEPVVEITETPATDAGLVPEFIPTGSETPQA